MAGVGASMGAHGELAGEEGAGEGERGHSCGGTMWTWPCCSSVCGGAPAFCSVHALCCSFAVREKKKGRRKEKGEEKKMKEKKRKKRKIYGNFSELENFPGEK
jgi:hypothetical protein